MRNVIENVISKILKNNITEGFTNVNIMNKIDIVAVIISVLLSQLLLLLLGKWLWNTYLVNSVSAINKIDSIWELFGISILIKLLIN